VGCERFLCESHKSCTCFLTVRKIIIRVPFVGQGDIILAHARVVFVPVPESSRHDTETRNRAVQSSEVHLRSRKHSAIRLIHRGGRNSFSLWFLSRCAVAMSSRPRVAACPAHRQAAKRTFANACTLEVMPCLVCVCQRSGLCA